MQNQNQKIKMDDKGEGLRGDILFIMIKILVMIIEIAMESFGFVKNTVQGIPEIERLSDEYPFRNSTLNANYPQYIRSAYAYSVFYIFGIIYTIAYWVVYFKSKRREDLPFMGTMILFFCNMPVMVCDMYMIKSRGEMSWEYHGVDLGLHMVFCFNSVVHIYMNLYTASEPKGAFSYVILLALSWLLTCCLYAPVTWSMVGWQWLGAVDLDEVVGIKVHDRSYKVLSAFILLGNIGQFIIAAIIVMAIYSHFASHPPKDPPKDPLMGPPTSNQSNKLSPNQIPNKKPTVNQNSTNQVGNNKLTVNSVPVPNNKNPTNNQIGNNGPSVVKPTNPMPIPVIQITDNQASPSKPQIPEIIIA